MDFPVVPHQDVPRQDTHRVKGKREEKLGGMSRCCKALIQSPL